MNTIDRLRALAIYYRLPQTGLDKIAIDGGAHVFLNKCDKKAGIFTDGGVKHDPHLKPPHGSPRSTVGERIQMHEAHAMSRPPTRDRISISHWGMFERGGCDCGCQHGGYVRRFVINFHDGSPIKKRSRK